MTRNTKLSTPNNRVIAPQSTCKSIKHQVSILPHWLIPSLLPLHLVGTSNSNIVRLGLYILVGTPGYKGCTGTDYTDSWSNLACT